jgi:hypothetical protein
MFHINANVNNRRNCRGWDAVEAGTVGEIYSVHFSINLTLLLKK